MIDLRHGKWEDALIDVERVDTLLVHAPYSARTHAGHDGAAANGVESRGGLAYRPFRVVSRGL